MNYSGVNWTSKTAITKTDLDTMDAGIKAASEEIENIKSSVIALQNANIQRGFYVFAKGVEAINNHIVSTVITTNYKFVPSATIIATIDTSRPDLYSVSVQRIKNSTNTFNLHFYASTLDKDNKLLYDIGVHWIIIN